MDYLPNDHDDADTQQRTNISFETGATEETKQEHPDLAREQFEEQRRLDAEQRRLNAETKEILQSRFVFFLRLVEKQLVRKAVVMNYCLGVDWF